MPTVVIAGCGFLGEAAADLFSEAGWDVLGICRESSGRLAGKKYAVRDADIRGPMEFERPWRGADALVHCASTRGGDAAAYRGVYLEGLLNLISALQPRRTAFVSSTSVYAQTDGSLVDETSAADPETATGKILRDAEGVALASGGYVLRLAALYGPGRLPLRRGGDPDRWTNHIHRDDAARALVHVFTARVQLGIYNVCDDTPVKRGELAAWMGVTDAAGPAPSSKRGASNKRVSNALLHATGWAPLFPSCREGIFPP